MKFGGPFDEEHELDVAPHWGAWIEMVWRVVSGLVHWSHPTGVRGLKLFGFGEPYRRYLVAPHWGAWIEIELDVDLDGLPLVAPHWGAWIEIESVMAPAKGVLVAPHWGAWIEI